MVKVLFPLAIAFLTATLTATADEPRQLQDARYLVSHLALPDTEYEHGKGEIVWQGKVTAHCDCSGLVNNLLMHSDGVTDEDLKNWLGAKRPTARRYHDAIADGKKPFQRIALLKEARPGDILAVKYSEIGDDRNTGHMMLIDAAPQEMRTAPTGVEGAVKQWQVQIIDSSMSGHGTTDTRYEKGAKHTGVGRGLLRIFTDAKGEIVAYTWSTETQKTVYPQSTHNLVIGRFVKE